MHIDHSKLVELLTETSGIEKETVEKYISELVAEINEALEEGDAYEVDGFGVFSQIGENTIFIPADDLATEINYKYAGMSPILLDEDRGKGEPESTDDDESDEDPFAGLLDDITEEEQKPEAIKGESDDIDTTDVDDLSDPFAIEDEEPAEEEVTGAGPEEEEFKEIPNGIDYSSEADEDESRVLFSGLLDMDEDVGDDEPEVEAEDQKEPELQPDPAFRELETDVDEEDDAPFDLDDDKTLSEEEIEDEAEEDIHEPVLETEKLSEAIDDESVEEDQDMEFSETETSDEISDEKEIEDDPFETLAGDDEEEDIEDEDDIFAIDEEEPEEDRDSQEEEKEVIPVIKNVASEKQRNKKKLGKETKKPKEPASKAPVPVFLWVVLFIVIIGGGVYGLGYFGVVDIPGITPATNQSQQIAVQQNDEPEQETPPQQSSEEVATVGEQTAENPGTEETDEPVETTDQPEDPVQETTADIESTTEAQASIPSGQEEYGMEGVPVESANDGYTIVVFSLSNQQNAEAQKNELESEGYRVLLAEIPSQQYGSLWRVSLGQFESMRDAAIAAEDLDASLSGNYFITKIQ